MPPKLLPKSPNEFIDDVQAEGADSEEERTVLQSAQGPQDTRNFEFVNATATTKPNVASRSSIRSHVMREANRLPYSSSSGPSVGSSSQGPPHSEGPLPGQMQRFRMSPSGFRPVQQSKRSRKGLLSLPGLPGPSSPINEEPNSNFQYSEQEVRVSDLSSVMDPADVMVRLPPFLTEPDLREISPPTNEMFSSREQNYRKSTVTTRSSPSFTTSSQPATIRGEQMDPFNTLPVPSSPRTQLLLRHYQARSVESAPFMVTARRQWFREAIQDPAFLFMKLSHAAGTLFSASRPGDSVESLAFKNEAIRIINQRLDKSRDEISEATLATVACIISYESINGSLESVQIHISGLQQMIKARGGLTKDNCGSGILRLIAWADIQSANALSCLPQFPSIDILLEEISPSDTSSDPTQIFDPRNLSSLPWAQSSSNKPPYATVLEERVLNQLSKLQHLATNLQPVNAAFDSESHNFWLSDAIYDVQRGFILALHELQDIAGINQCCCIAGLIFIDCFLRNVNCRDTRFSIVSRSVVPIYGLTQFVNL